MRRETKIYGLEDGAKTGYNDKNRKLQIWMKYPREYGK